MALTNRRLSTPHSLQSDAVCFALAMIPRVRLMSIKVPGPIPVKTAF
jgi:hypothetical protein